jgi:hypothetical protein
MKKSWMDRRPSDQMEPRYAQDEKEYDLSWAVRAVRAELQLSTVEFAWLIGSNHSSIVRCERRQRSLRASTLEAIRKKALEHGMEIVLFVLDREILLARKRAEKGGWR